MSRIEAFIPTRLLFDLVVNLARQHNAQLVFQRFQSEQHSEGLFVFQPEGDLVREYIDGGFKLIFISLRALPRHEKDLQFFDREAEYIVEVTGGRQIGLDLEQVVIRPLAKKSKALKAYRELHKMVAAVCHRGVLLNGHAYPKPYYARDMGSVRMWVDLDTRCISAIPAPAIST
jgi:hypothetical protein